MATFNQIAFILQKISSTTEKTEERTIFLFNDLILLACERKMIGLYKYRLRAVFHACHTQVCEGDNLEREHSFYIRGSDGNGPSRCVELYTDTQKDKNDWVESICAVIEDCRANSATFGGKLKSSLSETNNNHAESRNCADCDSEFSLFYRGIKCGKCKRKLCKKCFGRYRTESKHNRICESCVKNMGFDTIRRSASAQSNVRQNVLAVPAQGKGVLHASKVKFRGSLGKVFERYFVVRNDFCLYSYNSCNDECALAMLPLPGCEVKLCGERFTFSLRVGSRRMYTITVEDEQNQLRWMAVLDLAANAQLQQSPDN
ncbi:PH domain protein [Oesophagostomum dentatum]|uniref:PH domain protein n=1 Tax=Oesophagostomum dentatum TaxID=61180 RepID=A0A0B1SZC5_OESDE|nr:PH domain protein [Oesophagostomum dentatum]